MSIKDYINIINTDTKHYYILVSILCDDIVKIIKDFNADIFYVKNNKIYNITVGNKSISIWCDFSNIKHIDDQYLCEFRNYCNNYDIADIRFYFPDYKYNTINIFNQFKKCFNPSKYSCQTLHNNCDNILDLLYYLKNGKLMYFKFNYNIRNCFQNDSCIIS